jgi:hypothetical protein
VAGQSFLKGVFDLFSGVLHARLGLVDLALVLGALVAGGASGPFFGLPPGSSTLLLIWSEVPTAKPLPNLVAWMSVWNRTDGWLPLGVDAET